MSTIADSKSVLIAVAPAREADGLVDSVGAEKLSADSGERKHFLEGRCGVALDYEPTTVSDHQLVASKEFANDSRVNKVGLGEHDDNAVTELSVFRDHHRELICHAQVVFPEQGEHGYSVLMVDDERAAIDIAVQVAHLKMGSLFQPE